MKQRSARFLYGVGAFVCAATTALIGTASGIACGTVRVGSHVEPNTVVWLDAAGAPGSSQTLHDARH